jgi:hypothetical protein
MYAVSTRFNEDKRITQREEDVAAWVIRVLLLTDPPYKSEGPGPLTGNS